MQSQQPGPWGQPQNQSQRLPGAQAPAGQQVPPPTKQGLPNYLVALIVTGALLLVSGAGVGLYFYTSDYSYLSESAADPTNQYRLPMPPPVTEPAEDLPYEVPAIPECAAISEKTLRELHVTDADNGERGPNFKCHWSRGNLRLGLGLRQLRVDCDNSSEYGSDAVPLAEELFDRMRELSLTTEPVPPRLYELPGPWDEAYVVGYPGVDEYDMASGEVVFRKGAVVFKTWYSGETDYDLGESPKPLPGQELEEGAKKVALELASKF
ncbi:hypothetical protein AB0H34_00675 [Saccharopolyspora shandongensis]|uniref:hypothetical protein n=1 Tax=Saccharopolyspora shandongensis TaxID=418495 RepID=UPI0033F2BB4D